MSIPSPADVGSHDPLNELIRITFDNAHDAIAVSDACGRLVEVNDRFTEIYGYSRHEAIGLGLIDLRNPGPLGRCEDDLAALANSGRLRFETEHRRRDGCPFPVEASVRQMTLNGALYRVSILRDVTERQEAQARANILTRLYGALQAANEALITSVARDELFARICRTCVEYGLRMAWVGLITKNGIHPDSF
ncbi:MAG: PAS domain S-box protein, partial [Rhodospirillales bacterium]|nr:PAS domain S-box protein [Rhodospirillales bacterium]